MATFLNVDEYAGEVERELPEGEGATAIALRVDYLLQRIQEEGQHVARVAAFTARRIQMIEEHAERETETHRKRIEWLESRVRLHVPSSGEQMEKHFGKKSMSLPHGTVGYRSCAESIAILDAQKALTFAKQQGLSVTVKESVNKGPLHDFIRETGEIPDPDVCGFKLEPGAEHFSIRPKGGEV